MGNSAGVLGTFFTNPFLDREIYSAYELALAYNGINSSLDLLRGKHDVYGSMAAGGISGALFKSTGTSAR